jgi:hypothetical protein
MDVSTYAGLGLLIVLLSSHADTLPNVDLFPALNATIGPSERFVLSSGEQRDA